MSGPIPINEIQNDRHRAVVRDWIAGKSAKQIADEHGYRSRQGHRIVIRLVRRLRDEGYDIPRRAEAR
jgi:transposase